MIAWVIDWATQIWHGSKIVVIVVFIIVMRWVYYENYREYVLLYIVLTFYNLWQILDCIARFNYVRETKILHF